MVDDSRGRHVVDCLVDRLKVPLPGRRAHRRLAPSLAYGRHAGPPSPSAKRAAVAVLLYSDETGEWAIPLTVRPHHMKDHAGQVCLPGGVLECRESAEVCALRETEEELGVPPSTLRALGVLTPVYVFGTNYLMQPVVFVARERPQWLPCPDEVAHVLEVSLKDFLTWPEASTRRMTRSGLSFDAPGWPWHGFWIWGATAMVLAEWMDVVRSVVACGSER